MADAKKTEAKVPTHEEELHALEAFCLNLKVMADMTFQAVGQGDMQSLQGLIIQMVQMTGKIAVIYMQKTGHTRCGKCGKQKLQLLPHPQPNCFQLSCLEDGCEWSSPPFSPYSDDPHKLIKVVETKEKSGVAASTEPEEKVSQGGIIIA